MSWDDLVCIWCELDVPEGWRPETAIDGIRLSPPPAGRHNLIAADVHRNLSDGCPEGAGVFQTQGVAVAAVGGIYAPDLCVIPRDRVPRGPGPVPAADVLLAVEITSAGNAEHDRTRKRWAYAHGGIAQYVLIDPHDPDGASVTVYTDPAEGAYRQSCRVAFGRDVRLAAPFDAVLETAAF